MITCRIFRPFKGTMEYHKTKDRLHIVKALGHKNIKDIEVYMHLIAFENDEFTSNVVKTAEEAYKLVEVEFEHICTAPEELTLFRKQK